MIEALTAWLINYGLLTAGSAIGAIVLGWILKKIPTGKWTKQLGDLGQKLGAAFTKFAASKIPFYNKVIEPIFIDTLAVVPAFIAGFIVGLKSDND